MLLLFNAIAHFCVDGLCASVLFGRLPESAMALVTVYNALAFATQCLIGIIADRWKEQRWAEGLSIIAIVLGWYLPVSPLARVLLIGLGNSVFHVTGGIMTMKRSAGRALELGVFVAEQAYAFHHHFGAFYDFFDVFHLLFLHPGGTDEAQEGNQRLLGGNEDILAEGLGEDLRILLLGELVGPVVGDEHDDVVERLAALDVFLVLFAGELPDMIPDRFEVAARSFGTRFVGLRFKVVREGAQRDF